jgi:ribose transport system substrate-binding protein
MLKPTLFGLTLFGSARLKLAKTVLECLTLVALVGCGASHEKRIILLTNGNSPYWDAVRIGMQDGELEFDLKEAGLKAIMEVNDGTPDGQIGKLRQFASQSDIAAVAVSALDANNVAVADEMRNLQSRGIHVITLDGDVDRATLRDARKFYLGSDNLYGGHELGVAAKNLVTDPGGYVQFVGRTGAQNAIDRMDGFKAELGDQYQEYDRMGDDLDPTRARDNVRNALRNFPDLKILVGIWSYNAPAIVDVMKESDKREQIKVVTFDAEPLAIEEMGQGLIDVMIVQNPHEMGRLSARLLKALVQKDDKTVAEMFPNLGQEDGDLYNTGMRVVVPDEGSPLAAGLFGKNTQFFKLDDFKKWLAERHLEGS